MSDDRELDHPLDRLIDAALPRYSAAEPLAGFEDRILNRTFAELSPKRSFARNWAFAIPAIACLFVVTTLLSWHARDRALSTTRSSPTKQIATSPSQAPSPSAPNIATTATPAKQPKLSHLRIAVATDPTRSGLLPKQDTFPSPSSLTAAEQSLVVYRPAPSRTPIPQKSTLLDTNPITISELHIQPLDIPTLDPPASNASESARDNRQP